MRSLLFSLGVAALLAGGCGGPGNAKVKGQVVENGQPKGFPGLQCAVMLTLMGDGNKPNEAKSFTAVLADDGSFEVKSSGGELPVGTYQVAIHLPATSKPAKQYKQFLAPQSPVRRDLKPGPNELTIDLGKPEG